MRKHEPLFEKKFIKDEHGTKVAFAHLGAIFLISTGRKVAGLQGGNVYGMDGQILGRLTPKGTVVREDETPSEAFFRLVGQ